MSDLRKAAEKYIRPGTIVDVDVKTTAILVNLLRQALAQPKREWVGLTAEEVNSIVNLSTFDDAGYDIFTDGSQVARIVEIRLKEKNT